MLLTFPSCQLGLGELLLHEYHLARGDQYVHARRPILPLRCGHHPAEAIYNQYGAESSLPPLLPPLLPPSLPPSTCLRVGAVCKVEEVDIGLHAAAQQDLLRDSPPLGVGLLHGLLILV